MDDWLSKIDVETKRLAVVGMLYAYCRISVQRVLTHSGFTRASVIVMALMNNWYYQHDVYIVAYITDEYRPTRRRIGREWKGSMRVYLQEDDSD